MCKTAGVNNEIGFRIYRALWEYIHYSRNSCPTKQENGKKQNLMSIWEELEKKKKETDKLEENSRK